MNIYIVEPFATGNIHVSFNASLLSIWRELFKTATLHLWAEREHIQHLEESNQELAYDKKKALAVLTPKAGSKRDWFFKHLQECGIIFRALITSLFARNSILIFSFVSPVGLFFLNSFLKIFLPRKKVLIVLHSLEILKPEAQRKKVDQVYASIWKKAFKKKSINKRYLVLLPSAAQYLLKHSLLVAQELLIIPHPYPFSPFSMREGQSSGKISLVHLGMARLSKRSEQFFDLASRFKTEIEDGTIEFRIIGAVQSEMEPFLHPYVIHADKGKIVGQQLYQEWCNKADYAIFCYQKQDYELTSSGAVMDAIRFGLPILGLENKFLESVFELVDPAPGVLYPDLETLEEAIHNMIREKKRSKAALQPTFISLQHHFSIPHVKEVLEQQLKGYINVEG